MHRILLLVTAIAGSVALQPPQAEITMLDGTSLSGQLQEITADAIRIEQLAGIQSVERKQVMSLSFPEPRESEGTLPQEILLLDGSVIDCENVARTAQTTRVEKSWIGAVQIPDALVRAVRLQAAVPEYSAQWTGYLERQSATDLLVIAKRGGDGLDFLAGNVVSIAPEKIEFLLDGDTIPVPPSRVYGVVFAKPEGAAQSVTPGVRLLGVSGQIVGLKDCSMNSDGLRITTTWGSEATVNTAAVSSIDFSSGRIRYLSDMEWLSEKMHGIDPPEQAVRLKLSEELTKLEQEWYRPQRDHTFEMDSPLRLRGRQYRKGLCMRSRSEISVALDRKFTTFEALAGVDDEVAFNLNRRVALTVRGDDQVLYSSEFATSQDPVPVSIPVENISTLTILVDYADNDSSCDWLDLAEARLLVKSEESK
ncbi:MAG: NPCBM/NEW2 domain-containing protein [Planctomycetaceae bacterium]|nr:NPCBM/NEW2 domain-containing protein [Planctomycetaceae bacterium]